MERVDEAYAIRRYQQAAALLPLRWQRLCRQVPEEQQAEAEELRLRAGQTLTLLLRGGEVPAARERPYPVVTQTELEQLCDGVTDYSRYAAADTLSRGYLTARGGFRIGVCGTAVLRDGVNTNLRDISSVTIRIAREQPGLSTEVLPQLFREGSFCSTLLLAPPGLGKTTLLRDLIRGLSDGAEGVPPHRVAAVEISSTLFLPLLKTAGIAVVTRIGADLCRDAGESAVASAVEMAGAMGALLAVLPLMQAAWEVLRSLL